MRIGYFLSSEVWGPRDLVAQAVKAEQAGFEDLWISDHYHPWNDKQGHSAFVWSTIGAIAQATDRMKVSTAVTCPTIRIHPAIIAQAAATSAVLLEGRFCLGLVGQRGPARRNGADLPTPRHFEQAITLVSEELATADIPCGPDIEKHVAAITAYVDAGFDELYINQIGPDQDAFFAAYRDHVLPRLRS